MLGQTISAALLTQGGAVSVRSLQAVGHERHDVAELVNLDVAC
jgi:hypothetical protein